MYTTHCVDSRPIPGRPNCCNLNTYGISTFNSFQYHPDTSETEDVKQNTSKFQDILEAYRILSKKETRAAFDKTWFGSSSPRDPVENTLKVRRPFRGHTSTATSTRAPPKYDAAFFEAKHKAYQIYYDDFIKNVEKHEKYVQRTYIHFSQFSQNYKNAVDSTDYRKRAKRRRKKKSGRRANRFHFN